MEKIMNKVLVAKVDELPENLGRTVHIGEGNLELAIFKLSSGAVRVIENRCPHKGGVLAEGMVSGEHVFCPMHDWKINMTDGNVEAPDIGCVKTFENKVVDGRVYVLLPEK